MSGIGLQAKVVIISQPSIEWIVCDNACLNAGIITIPLFPNSSGETLAFQIENSQPDFLIAENEDVLQKIKNATSYAFKNVFVMQRSETSNVRAIADLISEAKWGEGDALPDVEQSLPATIIYTSGTSGNPKALC